MNRTEIAQSIRSMRRYRREIASSENPKAAAIEALKRAGILTKTGKVAAPYKELLSN